MGAEAIVETSIKEWGTSRGIRIPKPMCEYCFMDIGSEITMQADTDDKGPFIILRLAEPRHSDYSNAPMIDMDDAFAGWSGDYVPEEADWGDDVGAEEVA